MEPLSKVLDRQQDLILRIQRAAGLSPADFDTRYLPAIRNLCGYVHLLPATDTEYFVGAGGLIRLSLEIGLHSLQMSHGSVFPMAGIVEKRSAMIPRWELATFLAAVCSQLYRPVSNMVVIDHHNNQWPQILMPLTDWAESVSARRYFIRWAAGTDTANRQSCAAFLISRVIPPEVLQYLNEDNNVIVPAMTASISGGDMNPSENPIARIVAPMMTRVIQEDMKRNSRNYGNYSLGIHLEPHLIDAMRRLIKGGQWTVNTKGARVWIGTDGVFIVWSAGAKDIAGLLTSDTFVGLPQDPDTIADILIEANVLVRGQNGSRYWTITLPETGALIDNAVRLANETLIFPLRFDIAGLRTGALTATRATNSPATLATLETTADPGKKPRVRRKKDDEPKEEAVSEQSVKTIVAAPALPPVKTVEGDSSEQPIHETSSIEVGEGNVAAPEETTTLNPPSQPEPRSSTSKETDEATVPSAQSDTNEPVAQEKKPQSTKASKPTEELESRYLGMLSRESQWTMRQIIKAQQKGTLTGVVVSLGIGLGISAEELSAHGMPTTDLLNDLSARNWLYMDKAKPLRKIHKIEVNAKQESLIIIRPEIAVGLGFAWAAPEEMNEKQ
jgi:conjugal transfer pilus assembly protein TraI